MLSLGRALLGYHAQLSRLGFYVVFRISIENCVSSTIADVRCNMTDLLSVELL